MGNNLKSRVAEIIDEWCSEMAREGKPIVIRSDRIKLLDKVLVLADIRKEI